MRAGRGQPAAHEACGARLQHARLPHRRLADVHVQHLVRRAPGPLPLAQPGAVAAPRPGAQDAPQRRPHHQRRAPRAPSFQQGARSRGGGADAAPRRGRVCWDAFQDDEVNVTGYAVQAFRYGNASAGGGGEGAPGAAVTPKVPLGLHVSAYVFGNVTLKARAPVLHPSRTPAAGAECGQAAKGECWMSAHAARASFAGPARRLRPSHSGGKHPEQCDAILQPPARQHARKRGRGRRRPHGGRPALARGRGACDLKLEAAAGRAGGRHVLCARVGGERGGPGGRAGLAAHHGRGAAAGRPAAGRRGRHRVRVHARRGRRRRRHRVLAVAHAVRRAA